MKKILLYTTSFFPSVGGTERATYLLAKQLLDHNYQATIVTRTPDPEQEFPDGNENLRIIRNPGLLQLGKLCRDHDVVIVNGGFSVRAWLGIVQSATPFILIHAMITSGLREGFQPLDIIGNLLRKKMKSEAKVHVGVSKAVLQAADVEGVVIPNMIDPEITKRASQVVSSPKKYDLIFVGRLIASKGLQDILKAVAQISSNGKKITLAVIGGGSYENEAKELSRKLGIDDQVDFKGFVNADELAQCYAESKILIHTPNAPEGFGMGLIEAMAFGLPVIVNDKPALPETAGDAGIIVPQSDCDALAEAINMLLSDDKKYQQYSEKAKSRAQNFKPSVVFKQWEKIL